MKKALNVLFILLLIYIPVQSQQITTVSPDSAKQGESITVTISGLNTNFKDAGTVSTWFKQVTGPGTHYIIGHNINIIGRSIFGADFSLSLWSSLGYYDVYTYDSIHGYLIKPNGFKVLPNTVSLNELEERASFEIFPNPVRDILNIEIKDRIIKSVNIYNSQGLIQLIDNSGNKDIDVSALSSGMYIIEIVSNEFSARQKLIIE